MELQELFQGEVKILTGGIVRERIVAVKLSDRQLKFRKAVVRRSGEIPEPTVTVRMEETP